MALTKEEADELAELEADEKKRKLALADETKKQHLEALRMAKRLAAKHGVVGRDYIVLETTVGNIAIRRPLDVEIDVLLENTDDRGTQEKFATAIVVEPTSAEMQPLMAMHSGLVGAIVTRSLAMLKVVREEEVKK